MVFQRLEQQKHLNFRIKMSQDFVDQFVPFDEKIGEKDNSWDQELMKT
jgi:hypothetical protein